MQKPGVINNYIVMFEIFDNFGVDNLLEGHTVGCYLLLQLDACVLGPSSECDVVLHSSNNQEPFQYHKIPEKV